MMSWIVMFVIMGYLLACATVIVTSCYQIIKKIQWIPKNHRANSRFNREYDIKCQNVFHEKHPFLLTKNWAFLCLKCQNYILLYSFEYDAIKDVDRGGRWL